MALTGRRSSLVGAARPSSGHRFVTNRPRPVFSQARQFRWSCQARNILRPPRLRIPKFELASGQGPREWMDPVSTLLASLVASRCRAVALVSKLALAVSGTSTAPHQRYPRGEASQFWSMLARMVSRATDQRNLMDSKLRVGERPELGSSRYCWPECEDLNKISVGKLPLYH